MPIPDYQFLMLPVLRAAAHGEVRIGAVVDEVADLLKLSPEERTELLLSGKQTIFSNRVHWAKSYLGKAQLIELTRRGYFAITQRGRSVLQQSPTSIDNRFLNQFESFRQFKERSKLEVPGEVDLPGSIVEELKQTPDEALRAAHQQLERVLAQDLLDRVRSAPPDFFERLIVSLLLSMGTVVRGLTKRAASWVDRVTVESMESSIRMHLGLIAFTFRPSDTLQETTLAQVPSEISSGV